MRGFADKQTTPMPFSEASAIAKKGEAEYGGKVAAEGSGAVEPVTAQAKAPPEEPEIEKVEPEVAKAEPEPDPDAATPEPAAAAPSRVWSVLGPLLVLVFAIALIGGTLYIARHL